MRTLAEALHCFIDRLLALPENLECEDAAGEVFRWVVLDDGVEHDVRR